MMGVDTSSSRPKALSTLSQKSETVAENCRRIRRQSHFCATVQSHFLRQCGHGLRLGWFSRLALFYMIKWTLLWRRRHKHCLGYYYYYYHCYYYRYRYRYYDWIACGWL